MYCKISYHLLSIYYVPSGFHDLYNEVEKFSCFLRERKAERDQILLPMGAALQGTSDERNVWKGTLRKWHKPSRMWKRHSGVAVRAFVLWGEMWW